MHVARVVVLVVLVVVRRAHVLELVDGAAFLAALDGPVAADGQPERDVAVGRRAGAAQVLLVAEAFDYYWVVHRACYA